MMGRHETHASPAQQRIANLMPLGGIADAGGSKGLGVAASVFEEDETQPGSFKITTCGYGPGGPSLAKHLARQARVWEELGRPGAECLELAASPPETIGGGKMLLDRPHVHLAVRWPAP
jgi:hypothetical protein